MDIETKRALATFLVALEDKPMEGAIYELYYKAQDLLLKEDDYCKLIELARDYKNNPLDYISHLC